MIKLFETQTHKNIMFNDLSSGKMIQANQHIIVNKGEAIVLDPGGHKVHTKLFAQMASIFPINGLKHIFFSHQDPDIVAAANAWLMFTESAQAYLPSIWTGFVAHFGVDDLSAKRVKLIPDEGMTISVGGDPLKIIPAHFLHSPGNFQVYDPISKILYSGDMGASPAAPYAAVEDFNSHIKYIEGFHKRYMPSTKAMKMWVKTVKTLDIEIMAPQHGAILNNKALVNKFIEWADQITVGTDVMGDAFIVPA